MTCTSAKTAWLVLGLLPLLSCTFDPRVTNASQVSCNADVDCPAGLKCQQSAHHCVAADQLDDTPPSLSSVEETVVPHFDNPLASPTALGPHSTLRLRLFVSEPIVAPTLQAPGVDCELVPSTEATAVSFDCQTTADAVDGPIAMTAVLVDLAELTTTTTISLKTPIDVTSPPPPDGSPGKMRLRSSPWGDATTNGKASLQFSASAGVISESVSVRIMAGTAVLASQSVEADGSAKTVELPLVDNQSFSAQSVDGAGNSSMPVVIRDVVWVASFWGKRAGESFPNPHRFEATRAETEALEGIGISERGESDGIASTGGIAAVISGAGTWRRRGFNVEPDGLGNPGAAYDPRRARVVRFSGLSRFGAAGLNSGGFGTGLWEWNGHDWLNIVQSDPEGDGNPEPRLKPTLIYSAALGGIVLYGGSSASNVPFTDSWLWNGSSWRRLPDGPPGRIRPIAYEDPSLGGVVIYSGERSNGQPTTDAWVLTGTGWRGLDAGSFPTPRIDSVFATDAVNDVTWVYGGAPAGDLWRRTGSTWQQLTAPSTPEPRTQAGATFDDRRGVFQVYGGVLPDGGVTDELWELSGTTWTQRTASLPGPRAEEALVYDAARGETLVFGNQVSLQLINADAGIEDTWAFNGQWRRVARQTDTLTTWGSRNLVMNTTLGAMQTVGTVGDLAQPTVASLTENGWQLTDAHAPALPVVHSRIAYEQAQDDLLLFGGASDESPAQIWKISASTATLINNDAGVNAQNVSAVLSSNRETYVVSSGTVSTRVQRLLFGNLVNTGVLDSRLISPCAALDAQNNIILSGFDSMFDTKSYSYDGTIGGQPIALPPTPITIGAFGVVYDTARNAPLIVGGVVLPVRGSSDVYELQAGSWSRVPTADPDGNGAPHFTPGVLDGGVAPVIGFDSSRQRTIAVEPDTSNTWEFDIAHQRPQVQLRFSLESIPPSATVSEATLSIVAGGTGGVTVFPRMRGYWSTTLVTPSTASVNAPTPLTVSISDPAVFRAMLSTRRELAFGLRPVLFNADSTSQLSVDSSELEVHYRLP